MRHAISILVLSVVAALPLPGALAAESDTMSVSGAITAQNACSLSLSSGGAIDYGLITASTLNASSDTALPQRSVSASISCTTPTRVAVALVDNRVHELSSGDGRRYGLGRTRTGNPMGHYYVFSSGMATVDGASVRVVFSHDGANGNWENAGNDYPNGAESWRRFNAFLDERRSFAPGNVPAAAFTTAQFRIDFIPYIYSLDALQLQGAERIDGSVVVDLLYL
jgi:spore coat protein U-like protein